MKISKLYLFVSFALAICLSLVFVLPKNLNRAIATSENQINNILALEINSSVNTNREENDVLINKSTNTFYEGYIYSPKADSNNNNMVMTFNVNHVDLISSNSFYLWIYIPEIIVQDLVVCIYDETNSLQWQLRGSDLYSQSDFYSSLSDMIIDYNGSITRGWKLFEFCLDDAIKTGEVQSITSFSVYYSFSNADINDDTNFAVAYPFVADKINLNSAIANHQEYVVYAEKESFLAKQTSTYVGDVIKIKTIKDFFSYAIVGRQNVLSDSYGYSWNIALTKPSSGKQTLFIGTGIDIEFAEKGYYLIDINLTTSDQDVYPLISQSYNIYVEEFAFGYFQKNSYTVEIDTNNIIILTLSDDFNPSNQDFLTLSLSDKNLADATYYIEENIVYIKLYAKEVGSVNLAASAVGYKQEEKTSKIYEKQINVIITEKQKETNYSLLWVCFGLMMCGFAIYLVISFVKVRKFGVK